MAVMTSFVFQGFVFRNSVEISKLLSFIGNTGFWAEVLPGTNKLYQLQKFKISNRELEELKVCSRVTGIQMWGLHPNAAPQKTKILNLILSHGLCIIRGFTRKKIILLLFGRNLNLCPLFYIQIRAANGRSSMCDH